MGIFPSLVYISPSPSDPIHLNTLDLTSGMVNMFKAVVKLLIPFYSVLFYLYLYVVVLECVIAQTFHIRRIRVRRRNIRELGLSHKPNCWTVKYHFKFLCTNCELRCDPRGFINSQNIASVWYVPHPQWQGPVDLSHYGYWIYRTPPPYNYIRIIMSSSQALNCLLRYRADITNDPPNRCVRAWAQHVITTTRRTCREEVFFSRFEDLHPLRISSMHW